MSLYSAMAREALAERMGLLLTALCDSEMKFLHIPYGLTANVTKHDMYEPVRRVLTFASCRSRAAEALK